MEKEKNWLKFVISGSVSDYLHYAEACKKENISEGNANAFYNRCSDYKRDECGRK